MVTTLQRGWCQELSSLVASAERRLVIAAPFISREGADAIIEGFSPSLRDSGRLEMFTDLSPAHVSDGSLDPGALVDLHESVGESTLWHVPRFHAKVYIADESYAIVTSGNLTSNAFYRNAEYGVLIEDHAVVESIQSHFDDFRAAGTTISFTDLLDYAKSAAEVRKATLKQRDAADPGLTQMLGTMLAAAEDQLIRLRLDGGAVHTVFANTIHYLLMKYGPMKTTQIHELIQSLHPDLCDDSVDRVIDGQSYGKKWKHAVRTAQQQLKRSGVVEYTDSVWRLTGNQE